MLLARIAVRRRVRIERAERGRASDRAVRSPLRSRGRRRARANGPAVRCGPGSRRVVRAQPALSRPSRASRFAIPSIPARMRASVDVVQQHRRVRWRRAPARCRRPSDRPRRPEHAPASRPSPGSHHLVRRRCRSRRSRRPPPRRAQLLHDRADDPGARCADRMSERDRAALHVDRARIESEARRRGQRDRRERFVDLPDVRCRARSARSRRAVSARPSPGTSARYGGSQATPA